MGRNGAFQYIGRLLLFMICCLPGVAAAEDVNLTPAYIAGTVSMGSYNVVNTSFNAIGNSYRAVKKSNGGSYSMTVQGGDWLYDVSSSCNLSGGNASTYVSFNNRSLAAAPGQTVTNNYIHNAGVIRFQLNNTGDPFTSARGESTASKTPAAGLEKTYSDSDSIAFNNNVSGSWDMPVVPNQQISVVVRLHLNGQFGGYTNVYTYTLNVSPGEVVVVPLDFGFIAPPKPDTYIPPPYIPPNYDPAMVTGTIQLNNLPEGVFSKHSIGTKTVLQNPGAYDLVYSILRGSVPGNFTSRPATVLNATLADANFPWPVSSAANVPLEVNQTKTVNFTTDASALSGKITIRGSAERKDLKAFYVALAGINQIYDPFTKTWEDTPTKNLTSNIMRSLDKVTSYAKNVNIDTYNLYLPAGDYYPKQWMVIKDVSTPYKKYSETTVIYDNTRLYDGKTWFNKPVHVAEGEANIDNMEFCLGSAVFRFKIAGGGNMRYPSVTAGGAHYRPDGVRDLTLYKVSAYASVSNVPAPEVEIIGPNADYTVSPTATSPDGTQIYYPQTKLTMECGVKKYIDLPGPVLGISAPESELVTNAASINVAGTASSNVAVTSVTVNGQGATLVPSGGTVANEMAFTCNLALVDGGNSIVTQANDAQDAATTDERTIYVDRWLPTVSVLPGNGSRFTLAETAIPLQVDAADRGYGFTLKVYIDGAIIYEKTAGGNADMPSPVSYAGTLGPLSLGDHLITAVAADRAGNSTTATSTVTIMEDRDSIPPAITLTGSPSVTVEAGSVYADAGATALDDRDGNITGSIITSNPVNTRQPGSYTVSYNVADSAANPAAEVTRQVTVVDTTVPVLSVPANQTIEATSAAGAAASFTATATDLADPVPAVTCSPASGSTFALGATTVTCSATDASGNRASGSFTITVQDTTPPDLTVPATITVVLNSSTTAPAVLAFMNGATAIDIVDLSVVISSSATPLFSTVGSKVITFTAVDDYGNTTIKTSGINVVYGCGDTYLNNEETNFLTPVNLLKPFKPGSTIPVKLHLCDASGIDIMTAVARIYVQMISNNEPVGDPIEVTSTSGADIGNYFRIAGAQYLYNLYTKSLTSGSYQIQAVLDDGTTRIIPLFLKQ